ncbi:MAG: ATP-binding cassette domain-containing protein [Anaerolineae bacterium]|nr:ATP-binding cassette domain-containing protein [Anaerolineae bacterium]
MGAQGHRTPTPGATATAGGRGGVGKRLQCGYNPCVGCTFCTEEQRQDGDAVPGGGGLGRPCGGIVGFAPCRALADGPLPRRAGGYVPQDPFLFSGTVRDNIRYARPEASDEEVLEAALHIGGGDWLADLPHGLDTDAGERGANLSMGQRQLVALARVLLKGPAIFILDEATASVDPFTEAQIQEGLELLMRERTAIIIAHRLWTVQRADRILVIEGGRIVEEGTHGELMARGGHYATLYNTYFRHQSLEYVESLGART